MIVAYILLAVVISLFMVLIHEFGHYIVGKILKFKITEFSVGFGFPIFSHTSKKTGEKFSLRIFPLGGYCSFYGEDEEKESPDPLAFNNQKPWKRILVFFAGVTANFLTAIIFSWILLCCNGYDVPQIAKDVVYQENVYQAGDVITHINGKKIDFAFGENYVTLVNNERIVAIEKYQKLIDEGSSIEQISREQLHSFEMTVNRNGDIEKLTIYIYPKYETSDGQQKLNAYTGLESRDDGQPVTKAYCYGAWEGFCRSFEMAFGFAWVVLKSLRNYHNHFHNCHLCVSKHVLFVDIYSTYCSKFGGV